MQFEPSTGNGPVVTPKMTFCRIFTTCSGTKGPAVPSSWELVLRDWSGLELQEAESKAGHTNYLLPRPIVRVLVCSYLEADRIHRG